MYFLMLLAALGAQEMRPQPSLDWMAGYWLSCDGGREVAEAWSQRRGGVMLGTNISVGAQSSSWEQMRIEALPERGNGLSFVAQPRGAREGTRFALTRWAAREAVFENPDNDFPQRVIYRRVGDRLIGRIEGRAGGREQSMEWQFRSAPFNSRCPRPR